MKKRVFALLCAVCLLVSMTLSVNAVSIQTKCTKTYCENRNVTVTLGSGGRSLSGTTVTAYTSNTSSRALSAYVKAGMDLQNGDFYANWNMGKEYTSISVTRPSSTTSAIVSTWSNHVCESECWYCLDDLTGSAES